eukprot:gb/GECG01014552.1/.p1 GENE.gb/GECG01014552.1/~~gb/GECG01014552.1/.p1  ORF type:complete len:913 (+),score=83.69 gb/GECG01014552.1/:1-2739(+)
MDPQAPFASSSSSSLTGQHVPHGSGSQSRREEGFSPVRTQPPAVAQGETAFGNLESYSYAKERFQREAPYPFSWAHGIPRLQSRTASAEADAQSGIRHSPKWAEGTPQVTCNATSSTTKETKRRNPATEKHNLPPLQKRRKGKKVEPLVSADLKQQSAQWNTRWSAELPSSTVQFRRFELTEAQWYLPKDVESHHCQPEERGRSLGYESTTEQIKKRKRSNGVVSLKTQSISSSSTKSSIPQTESEVSVDPSAPTPQTRRSSVSSAFPVRPSIAESNSPKRKRKRKKRRMSVFRTNDKRVASWKAICWKDFLEFQVLAVLLSLLVGGGAAALPIEVMTSGFVGLEARMLVSWYVLLAIVHEIATLTMILFSCVPYLRKDESLQWRLILKALHTTAVIAIVIEDVLPRSMNVFTPPFYSFGTGSTLCFIAAAYVCWEQCKAFHETDYRNRDEVPSPVKLLQLHTWPALFRRRVVTMILISLCAFTYYLFCGLFLFLFVVIAKGSVLGQLVTGFFFTVATAAFRALAIRAVFHWGRVQHWPLFCGCLNLCTQRSSSRDDSGRANEASSAAEVDYRLNTEVALFLAYWYEFMSELYTLYITPDVVNAAVFFAILFMELVAHLYPTLMWTFECLQPLVPGTAAFQRTVWTLYEKFCTKPQSTEVVSSPDLTETESSPDLTEAEQLDAGTTASGSFGAPSTITREDIPLDEPSIAQESTYTETIASLNSCESGADKPLEERPWVDDGDIVPSSIVSQRSDSIKPRHVLDDDKTVAFADWMLHKTRWLFLSIMSLGNATVSFLVLFTYYNFGNNRHMNPLLVSFDTYWRAMTLGAASGVIYILVYALAEYRIRSRYRGYSLTSIGLHFFKANSIHRLLIWIIATCTALLNITYFAAPFNAYRSISPDEYLDSRNGVRY